MAFARLTKFSYIEGIEGYNRLPRPIRIAIATVSFLLVLILCGLAYLENARAFSGGSGTWNDPYVITTCAQLESIGDTADLGTRDYVLGNDIDCTGFSFYPIGHPNITQGNTLRTFMGRFDGAGHTISHVTVGAPTGNSVGIFGEIDDAYIHNLTLDHITSTGQTSAAILTGTIAESAIVGVTLTNSTINGVAVSGNPGGDPYNGTYLYGRNFSPVGEPIYIYNPVSYTEPSSYTPVASCSALASAIKANPLGWYSLSSDIDCAGDTNLIPFSTSTASVFTGRLEGSGHTINGISISQNAPGRYLGLFARMYGVVVHNLTLAGSGISNTDPNFFEAGALAGVSGGYVLDGVHSTVPITVGGDIAGGLIGEGGGIILNSSVQADITVLRSNMGDMGGLVGQAFWNDIENSTYVGNLTGYYAVGGIVGNTDMVNFNNVHATTTISGVLYFGGLAGPIWGFEGTSTVTNSSAHITVTDSPADVYFDHIGGIAGEADNTTINNSVTDVNISFTAPTTEGGDSIGGFAGAFSSGDQHGIYNSTSTALINLVGDSGGTWYSVGGGVGKANAVTIIANTYASSTLTFGTTLSPAQDIEGVGGLVGSTAFNGMTFDHSVASTTIVIQGDATNTYVDSIGSMSGYVGSTPGTNATHDSHAVGSITINGNDVEDTGGFSGCYKGPALSDSYASTTIAITAPTVKWIGGFAGCTSLLNISRTAAFGSIVIHAGQNGTGKASLIGGFAGEIRGFSSGTYGNSTTTDSYSTVSIDITSAHAAGNAGDDFGGFTGHLYGSEALTHTYAAGTLTFHAPAGTYFSTIGGLVGFSDEATNAITDTFTTETITTVPGSLSVGGFIGTYNGSEHLSNNAYDHALTGGLCTSTDGTDPAWCADHTTQSFFYTPTNQPLAAWDFSTVWDSHICTYPTLKIFAPLFTSSCGGGATPPTVTTTSSASGVSDTAATLGGNLTALGTGTITTEGFQYGLTTAYGATTTSSSAGFSTGTFSTALAGLAPSTTYHFRSYASGSDGTGYGSDATFTTTAASSGSGGGTSSGGSHSSSVKDTTPPVITNVKSAMDHGKVTITWDTDEPATSAVAYGPTECLGLITPETDSGADTTTKHVVVLPASACTNSAHFSALSTDVAGNRSVNPGHSNNVQLCPASSPAPDPSLLVCTTPPSLAPPAPPVQTPPTLSETGNSTVTPPAPGSAPVVVVNGGSSVTSSRIVPVLLTPPVGALTIVIFNPDNPSQATTLPATKSTVNWDLCGIGMKCDDGPHTLAVYFVNADGTKTEPVTTRITLASNGAQAPSTVATSSTAGGASLSAILGRVSAAFMHIPDVGSVGTTARTIATVGIVVTLLGILWNFISTLRTVSDLPLMLARGFSTLFTFGFLRRPRRESWGTVYDSVTKRPLDPVVVTLFDAAGKEMKTSITDLDGRFGFFVPAGLYSLTAMKGHHTFPAKEAPVLDPVYSAPYRGGPIAMQEAGVIIKDVPLDPTEFDWNEAEKYRRGLYQFFSKYDRPFAYLSLAFSSVGAIAAVISVFVNPRPLNFILLALYVVVGILYLAGLGPRIYGSLRDAAGRALAYTLIRVRRPGSTMYGGHTVTDHLGRYYLLLPSGTSFEVSVEVPAGPDAYTPIWQGNVRTKNGYLNKIIRVPRV